MTPCRSLPAFRRYVLLYLQGGQASMRSLLYGSTCSSNLMTEMVRSSENFEIFYQITWHHITLQSHRNESRNHANILWSDMKWCALEQGDSPGIVKTVLPNLETNLGSGFWLNTSCSWQDELAEVWSSLTGGNNRVRSDLNNFIFRTQTRRFQVVGDNKAVFTLPRYVFFCGRINNIIRCLLKQTFYLIVAHKNVRLLKWCLLI